MPLSWFKRPQEDDCVSWVTPGLAVGHAPMSWDHLDRLKAAGIGAIVNLCAEFPDLPEIERSAGFDVYYLPIDDEEVPEMKTMDDALEWIDESIYLGKKVLVHCRHGIGRTGTIVSAFLLRKGLSAREVRKMLKKLRSRPASYCQWQLLRKYGRDQCPLTTREPSLERKHAVDLNPFFDDLESLFGWVEERFAGTGGRCGKDHMECCKAAVSVSFVEAVYITQKINTMLTNERRRELIGRASEVLSTRNASDRGAVVRSDRLICPFIRDEKCSFYEQRPLACRLWDHKTISAGDRKIIDRDIRSLSGDLFLAFTGTFLKKDLVFDLNDVISGKYVQTFFHALAREKGQEEIEK